MKTTTSVHHAVLPASSAPGVRPAAQRPAAVSGPANDLRGRPLRDLRISVTDRCNFRCTYCMPREVFGSDYVFMPHADMLTFEEITLVAQVAVGMGVRKLRLTGGEPLLRRDLETLVGMLAALRTPEGEPVDITLTTNGTLLEKKAAALKAAGLQRVTVSLDALDDALFARMSDSKVSVATVLRGIEAAEQAGLAPLKVNMVVRKGVNDAQILPMVERFRHTGHILRFIEFMDVGSTNGWDLREVMTGDEILARIGALETLESFGTNVVADTCIVVAPLVRPGARVLMTNSGKYAHYGPGIIGVESIFGSTEECVRSAISGRAETDDSVWQ